MALKKEKNEFVRSTVRAVSNRAQDKLEAAVKQYNPSLMFANLGISKSPRKLVKGGSQGK